MCPTWPLLDCGTSAGRVIGEAGFRQRSFVQRRSPLVRRSRALTICIFNRIVMTRQVHLSSSCSVLRACDTVCRSERGSETQSLYIIK